jgi:hypothetical protein
VTGARTLVEDQRQLRRALETLRRAPLDLSVYAAMEQRLRDAGRYSDANQVFLAGKRQDIAESGGARWVLRGALWVIGYGRRSTGTYFVAFLAVWMLGALGLFGMVKATEFKTEGIFLLALDLLLPAFIDLHYREKHAEGIYCVWWSRLLWSAYQLTGWALLSLVLLSATRYFS